MSLTLVRSLGVQYLFGSALKLRYMDITRLKIRWTVRVGVAVIALYWASLGAQKVGRSMACRVLYTVCGTSTAVLVLPLVSLSTLLTVGAKSIPLL